MSELIQKSDNRATIRWKLLTGVSALALTAYVSTASFARAEDADRPLIWVDLGGQLSWNENGREDFLPSFVVTMPRPPFETILPGTVERQAPTSWDENAAISFQPADGKWVLSAEIRYGKSGRNQYLNQLTQTAVVPHYGDLAAYQNISSASSEKHAILDFRAGRDVGLGAGINSSVDLGVRYVQFSASANTDIMSQPTNVGVFRSRYKFHADIDARREFSGVGPSLSWDASAGIAGNPGDGEIGIDWGVNAAVLFGRQRVRGHHETTKVFYSSPYYPGPIHHYYVPLTRTKRVTVPNLGGYAAVSWRTSNAKVSIGYRADMFFNAMDGGIDARKSENRGFYGPFASISIGIGD